MLSQTLPYKAVGTNGQRPDHPPRLFVHIPKTAGTSFRTAAESSFGTTKVLRDYGPESEATSRSVMQEVYETNDKNGVMRAFESDQAVLLAGHFPVQKYGRLIGLQNTVTIFRDPVEQVISHYRHAVVHHGYEDSLLAFAERKGIRNIQTRFLFNLDPALIGIVGLTESYRDSLALINERWNWSLKHRRKNVSDRFDRQGIEVSDKDRKALEDLNQDDQKLYRRACLVFENSRYCYRNRIEADPRGKIGRVEVGEKVEGWGFDMRSEQAAVVILEVNGKSIARVNCDQPSDELRQWKLPGNRKAGFECQTQISAGDTIEIKDAVTGLLLDRKVAA